MDFLNNIFWLCRFLILLVFLFGCKPDSLTGKNVTAAWFGSYATVIKSSESSSDEDFQATIQALQGTGQNLYGYGIDEEWDYEHFLTLLEASKDSGVKILAIMGERHFEKNNRWLSTDTSAFGRWDAGMHDAWLTAWKNAIETLSRLSATSSPQLIGLSADDFGGYVCSPTMAGLNEATGCYTKDDVASITQAGKTCEGCNPEFLFLPTIYLAHRTEVANLTAIGGHILGQQTGGDYPPQAGDEASVNFTFPLDKKPELFVLSFLYGDHYLDQQEGCSAGNMNTAGEAERDFKGKMFFFVTVNGNTVYEEDVWGDGGVRMFHDDIASAVCSKEDMGENCAGRDGQNEISVGLVVKDTDCANLRFMEYKTLGVWAVSMESDKGEVSYATSYRTPDDGKAESAKRGFYAAGSDDYRITDAVSGILAPFKVESAFYGEATYETLIRSAKEGLGDKLLFVVNYSRYWGLDINADILKKQIGVNALFADGSLLWDFPLEFYFLEEQRGVFSERPQSSPAYDRLLFFPQHATGMEGFYQKLSSVTELTGEVTVGLKDASTEGDDGYFVKKIISSD
ncbi:MAG: hypothetical protein HY541_08520, partial [Deltaproteobacteria bacterium]|nr:hypothetical protein [Deltaproteobacteria bacterium]